MKPGRKHGDNCHQIPNQFFFGGDGFNIDYGDLRTMPFAKLLKPISFYHTLLYLGHGTATRPVFSRKISIPCIVF